MRSLRNYLEHCERHSKQSARTKYPCLDCPVTLFSRRNFFYHRTSHVQRKTKNELPPERLSPAYLCSDCQKIFDSRDEFLKHVRESKKSDRVQCPCCSKSDFPSYRQLRQHLNQNHPKAETKTVTGPDNSACVVSDNLEEDLIEENCENVATAQDVVESSDKPDTFAMATKLATDISVQLQKIQNHHGIAQLAMDSIVGVFQNAVKESRHFSNSWVKDQLSEEQYATSQMMDPLLAVFRDAKINTWSKRNTICKRELNFVDQREVFIGQDELGDDCSIAYSTPRDLLARFMDDPTVKRSFEEHQHLMTERGIDEDIFGDFFGSPYYHNYILGTLTDEERAQSQHPICLGIYR